MPLSVAVIYDDTLREHSFTEYSETGREELNIESGQSHIQLFEVILPAMFDRVITVNNVEEAAELNADVVFLPTIMDFQLALPTKTKLDFYEIWIEYNMRLVDAEGSDIADWVLTSYGRAQTKTFLTAENGINDAAIVALRDLAASFSIGFSEIPEIQEWLRTNF